MWIPALLIWILNSSYLCAAQDYPDYSTIGDMGTEAPELSDDQPSLESVTSVDQLLQLLYPEYNRLQHCLRKNPLVHSDLEDLWGQPREEALFKVDGTLSIILEEIQRTSCQPREVCVEVAKEYPESTSQFFLPRCVALHRCGGCCNNEAFYCTNTSHTLVSKTLMELSPPRMERSIVMVTFINHTSCDCISKRPLHSIIRRAATDHLDAINYSERETEVLDSGLLALCGPNRVLHESSCECVCRNGLTEDSCDPGWKLAHNTFTSWFKRSIDCK
ncbi:hypothetical protein JOQ06_000484 [Pogonophryne albipinna]|uniref:Platelet-derived growth factor (PDGF) family profile domain-containing protein n=1 Tax=Pogonophryne albipinna TaxID=1090488 RepID=A0AAD6AFD4_9TELE|nr:hypothetical protein JOQ06_000484 [Pogonophryne albipinna]